VPMLQVVGIPVFVGAAPVAGLPEHTTTFPAADLRVVADFLLRPAAGR
jgi:hypothetical protein